MTSTLVGPSSPVPSGAADALRRALADLVGLGVAADRGCSPAGSTNAGDLPLTWHVELRDDPATTPAAPWPAVPNPPELRDAVAVLWVHGPGHVRVSAAVHTAWYAALRRGLDVAVVVGLERDPRGTTRVAALAVLDDPFA